METITLSLAFGSHLTQDEKKWAYVKMLSPLPPPLLRLGMKESTWTPLSKFSTLESARVLILWGGCWFCRPPSTQRLD